MKEWKEYELGDLTKWSSGGTPSKKNEDFWSGSIPWISAKTMTSNKVFKSSLNISEEGLISGSRLAQKDDILLLVRGSGLFNDIPINWVEKDVAFNQDIKSIRAKDFDNQEYIYYWLHGNKKLLEGILETTGIGAGKFDTGRLQKLIISIPTDLQEKEFITETARSIFDKIDLLHQQNETLEVLAQTLFRKWFAENDKEDLPLSDFIEINPRMSLKKGEETPYLEMKNVQAASSSPLSWYSRAFTSGTKFQNGDTLLARITPCLQNGKTCYVQFLEEEEIGWGSTEFLVFRTKAPFPNFCSYLLAKNKDFKAFAESTMTGSSGRQRVQTDSLKDYVLGMPTEENLKIMQVQLPPIEQKLKANAEQIKTLENLRDTLLPKLMSGVVRVRK